METKRERTQWLSVGPIPMKYRAAWDLQLKLAEARKNGRDVVLFLEHEPVFTLGRRGGIENLRVPRTFLDEAGISIVQVERGGDITYHGPGQLIVYPILDLEKLRLSVTDYVSALEEVIIRTASDWRIRSERNPRNRGIWVGMRKLASIGIAIRRGVSFHGVALNVDPDLEPFTWIHPCGLEGVSMTSMKKEAPLPVSFEKVCDSVKRHIRSVFRVALLPTSLSDLERRLQAAA